MSAPNSSDELYPIAVLIDELKHDDVTLRLNAIRRLSTIAQALGEQRTRDELIPFIDESVDDEDEVLTVLAEELGNFTPYVGGPEHAHILLSPLDNLAAVEEPLVRDRAVESLNKIAEVLSPQQIEEYYLPLIARLSSGEWFTSRTSATGLYATVYPRAPEGTREGLRAAYGKLCRDETPMVRRASSTNLAKLITAAGESITNDLLIQEVVPLYMHLASDEQDSVRLLTVDPLIALSEKLGPEAAERELGSEMKAMIEDKSWRVRYMIADRFVTLAASVSASVVKSVLIEAFIRLLSDTEAEVRTAIAGQIPGFAKLVDDSALFVERIIPKIQELVNDGSQHVRAALASQLGGLAPLFGTEATVEHLLPMLQRMLEDDFPDVRLNIIAKLDMVNGVIGIDRLSQSLLPAIVKLAEDKQWRVRLAIIEYIPILAQHFGVQFFDAKLGTLCMSWLGDHVFSIREAATVNLRRLTEVFGIEWATRTIIPQVLAMAAHPNYLYRMTTIFAISTLAPAVDVSVVDQYILPTITQLVEDPIPNIRFNVAKSYEVLIGVLKATEEGRGVIGEKVKPMLEKLEGDKDADVRYFAGRAVAATA
ncbi:protein phosphatase regulatory subunit Paa1 [Saitoella complicata NRRL Y-17804]|uniref:protein phosphatase regulatory subunit Paa1 n=1 Tax=Saitoella complicata (strain BCRC 22490 / CBS 7301 / JCM 7358 / NBRC 10748 / NRRL Y-17804) TaxID=698492 RepID=UPI0008677E34|nr:protein phosphatase regulatory subunit Paa1 [Saitoella complicata NRRL Y-17804]ODQ50800.1 protein phosphatase regulatory subunit Paa1 [Saitoella complicata NRRL Y-17804]